MARVGMDSDGDFVVAWASGSETQDGDGFGIFARRFTSAGLGGAEAQVNGYITGNQSAPDIAVDASGDFAVTWSSTDTMTPQDGSSHGVFARRFRANGLIDGPELKVPLVTTTSQNFSAIASSAAGDFVVAWQSAPGAAPSDIFARRYDVQALFDVDGNGLFEPLKDGILLRFAFGFTGETLIDGAVGDGCTRCDAPAIEAYLEAGV